LPEYRDDGEYSDGGSFYPYEEDPYYESYDDEEDAYDDEGERRGANKGIINAAFRRMFRKGKKGTEIRPPSRRRGGGPQTKVSTPPSFPSRTASKGSSCSTGTRRWTRVRR
jgi:hypothetical protein